MKRSDGTFMVETFTKEPHKDELNSLNSLRNDIKKSSKLLKQASNLLLLSKFLPESPAFLELIRPVSGFTNLLEAKRSYSSFRLHLFFFP
jgi:hypothetical protein